MKQIFLSPAIFEWHFWHMGWTTTAESKVNRSYELLEHSEQLARENASEFMIADALSNLKRAINVRLQLLEKCYSFSKAFPRNVGSLERLETVGLARPYLVKLLFELRNDIEHNDSQPPTLSRCQELIDLTWYFLRATDAACRDVKNEMEYQHEPDNDSGLWFEAKLISPRERKFEIRGLFDRPYWDGQQVGDALVVNSCIVRDRTYSGEHSNTSDHQRFVHGECIVPLAILSRFWRDIFK